jgi:hypothetical protein
MNEGPLDSGADRAADGDKSGGAERRVHERVEASVPCTLVGDDGTREGFDLIDLSESGVRIRCSRSLSPMTRIQVAMVLPGERVSREGQVKVQTMGVVVWCHPIQGAQFDTGVFFPELEPDTREMLKAYVHSAAA